MPFFAVELSSFRIQQNQPRAYLKIYFFKKMLVVLLTNTIRKMKSITDRLQLLKTPVCLIQKYNVHV
jgi:hypothetical protein